MGKQIVVEPFYKVKDFRLASILYEKGMKLDGVERENGVCYCIFCNSKRCESVISLHYNGELSVDSLALMEAMQTIKSMIFQ